MTAPRNVNRCTPCLEGAHRRCTGSAGNIGCGCIHAAPAPQHVIPEERPASERLFVEAGYLVEDTGRHTCGAGDEHGHEPGCGIEPVIPLDQLDAMMRASSRFAARILPTDEHEETVPVELYAGERYTPGRPARRPFATVELNREEAADLVLALGEPQWSELPEDQRPPVESLWGDL